jgi:hypothetical protein
MNIWNRGTRIPEIYGAIMALGLIIYFFIMYAAGLIHVIELRAFNLVIMLASIYYALKQFKRTHNGRLDYFASMVAGVTTAAIGAATFCLFIFIYLNVDRNLMNSIVENEPLGVYMNPYIASFIVFLEGVFSGLAVTYTLSNFVTADTPIVDRAVDKMPEMKV